MSSAEPLEWSGPLTKRCQDVVDEIATPNISQHYSHHIKKVANDIADLLLQKDKEYGGSWQRRGGVGAYMMLVRKSDRLEEQVKNEYRYDIFEACTDETKASESLVDTLKDQVGYGLLILSELKARGVKV